MNAYDARIEALTEELEREGLASDWLDYLVKTTYVSAEALIESAVEVFHDLLVRSSRREPPWFVELAFPLRFGSTLPDPGTRDDEVLSSIEYSTSMLGQRFPQYYLRLTNPPVRYFDGGRTTRTALTSSRTFSRPVVVQHFRDEPEEPAEPNEAWNWLCYVAPIA